MEFFESVEQADKYAASAIALMKKQGIPANPNNFAVWFVYFSGSDAELTATLDKLLEQKEKFTETRNAEIFHRFFTLARDGEAVNETADKIGAELAKVLEYLDAAGDDAAEYGKVLESITGKVSGPLDVGDLRALVADALSATRSMEQQTRELEDKLDSSSRQISQLKQDLEDMRHEAMTDGLTAIPNRKLFDIELRRAAMEATENGEDLCLLMVDIDHFKKFNDTYGHPVGDQVLKLLGSTLTACIKGQDTAARYGGEEFAIILPRTSLADAVTVAENIRRAVGTRKVINRTTGETLGTITVSIGVARFADGEPLGRLISRADEALYEAKRTGRDRVVSEEQVGGAAGGSPHAS